MMTILLAINSMIASAVAVFQADGEPSPYFNQGQLLLIGVVLLLVILWLLFRED